MGNRDLPAYITATSRQIGRLLLTSYIISWTNPLHQNTQLMYLSSLLS